MIYKEGNLIYIGNMRLKAVARIENRARSEWVKYNPKTTKEEFIISSIKGIEDTGWQPAEATLSEGGEVLAVQFSDRQKRRYKLEVEIELNGEYSMKEIEAQLRLAFGASEVHVNLAD